MERLCDLYRQLGNSLDLAETLATLDSELHRLISYDTLVVHLVEEGRLAPAYAAGPGFQELVSRELTPGEGLGFDELALAVPLQWKARAVGVLRLYRTSAPPFRSEDFKTVAAVAEKLAAAIDNAQRFRRAEQACARALFERLDAEVARTRRAQGRLAVVVCEVEGLDPDGALAERLKVELRRLCREYDFAAWSGNSLVMLLSDFAPAALAEKQARMEDVLGKSGLDAAIGAAFLPEDGLDAEDLLAAAHAAAHRHASWAGESACPTS